ncbi:hypothetical protein OMP38_23345 [Cohnella ginsengisoli]|uniref:Diacylglycerol glucosyltransferase N-terminal domain-containing protein n=1 Tax=Cohnella ginsengisoli TaxID=425004 RepID=A0A9X4QPE8_9BACL|nr:hypothetical protein [Cohnella ginsengisoli]MDG0793446.1 hypothetical protein [Cohnella ginsengisoli]
MKDQALTILIIYARFGDGHFQVSKALERQFAKQGQTGIREDRIHVTGIPIRRQFGGARRSRPEICREKGLDPDRTHVLVMIGALTDRKRLIAELLTLPASVSLILVAGRDARLYRRLN